MDGSTQISIRTSHDLSEIWNSVCQGKKVVLWCDGLRKVDSSSQQEKTTLESDVQMMMQKVHKSHKKSKQCHVQEQRQS